jgi:hypothetical protein
MCEVYLEAFFFLTGFRAEEDGFFLDLVDAALVADKATDRSAFSAILLSQASISEFSTAVTTETVGALTFRVNLIFGNPLRCNAVISFLVAGVTFNNTGLIIVQIFTTNCLAKKI